MPTAEELVEEAAGVAWDTFKTEHPSQAAALENVFGDKTFYKVMKTLENDDRYTALVEQTDSEASIVALSGTLLPIIIDAAIGLI